MINESKKTIKEKVTKLPKEKISKEKLSKEKIYKEKNEIVVKDFYADWCAPCEIQKPIIEKLKKIYGKKVKFEVIDVDKEPESTERFKIMAVPTIIILNNNILVKKLVGVSSEKVLTKEIDKILT